VPAQRIVVIGASAGGVEALSEIARGLPAGFAAPIFAVIHVPPNSRSMLPEILSRRGHLPAKHAEDRERYRAGVIYIAPPDRHMLIQRDTIRLVRSPRENRHRPAIDPLFRSAAAAHGAAVIGVVLTGSLDDGTAGLLAIKEQGGIAIVQDPADAIHSSMPQSALENVDVDFKLPVREISRKLVDVVRQKIPASPRQPEGLEVMEMEHA
jgi:two-component system chemotaxis response regulator CheB